MTKLRQKVTFQVWYNKSKGSETISEPEINKNLDWYIVNNFLIKVDEVKSDGNTSKDNETLLSTFSMDCFYVSTYAIGQFIKRWSKYQNNTE